MRLKRGLKLRIAMQSSESQAAADVSNVPLPTLSLLSLSPTPYPLSASGVIPVRMKDLWLNSLVVSCS